MVRVVRVESAEHDLHAVRLVIAIGVAQEHEIRLLGDIHAFGCKLEADGQVQMIRENGFLVRLAIPVGVFVDQDFVIRQRIAGAIGRISRHRRDPQPSFVIKGHLHGIGEIWKLLLAGKKLDLVALGNSQRLHSVFTIQILLTAVLDAWLIVRRHRRQCVGLAVIHGEIRPLAGGDLMDERITQCGHLAGLLDFIGIVLRAVRVVASAIGMHAVDEVVVVVPEVVLRLDRLVHQLWVSF